MTPSTRPLKVMIQRWCLVATLAIAFGYIEAAVVVYLRQIFHSEGFAFPIKSFPLSAESGNLVLVEAGREATTLVLIFAAAILSGGNRPQQVACFMIIFAVWDIFYYVFLKLILGWPASIMDWDVLFLIPVPWAGPVLAPVLISIAMLVVAALILYRDSLGKPIKTSFWDRFGFFAAGLIIVVSFCLAGKYMQSPDYAEHFPWVVFTTGLSAAMVVFAKCVYNKEPPIQNGWIGG